MIPLFTGLVCPMLITQPGNDRRGIRARSPDSKFYAVLTSHFRPGRDKDCLNGWSPPFPIGVNTGICDFYLLLGQWFLTLVAH